MFKNVAAKFMVFAFDATTNQPKTGDAANITAYVSKDYGTVTVLADTSATEMDATNAKGMYLFDAAQGETNGDVLMISGKSSTANIVIIGAPAVIFTRPSTGWLAPATAGRTLVVDASGLADANMVKAGPTGSGTAQTARDLGASVLLSSGTGTGQLSFTSGILKVDVDTIKTNPVVNAGTITFPTTATLASTNNITAATGVDITKILGTAISTPATAGILDVNVKNIDNDAASASGTVTFPNATLASTANITAGTITTVTNLTNAPTAGDFTATMKTSIGTAVAASAVASVTGNVGGNVTGSVGSVTGLTASDVGAIKAKTDSLTFTVAGQVDANIQYVNDVQVTGNGQTGTEWGP